MCLDTYLPTYLPTLVDIEERQARGTDQHTAIQLIKYVYVD